MILFIVCEGKYCIGHKTVTFALFYILIISFLSVFLFGGTCEITSGTTFYVGGNGPGTYTKIQEAIDDASSGDTVFVYNGTYYEHLNINKTIDLIGEDKNTTIIDGDVEEKDDYDFTFAWMTDTQHYCEKYPYIYDNMTQWIADNKENEKIIYCIHTGDIVENWDNKTEWNRANHSMTILENASVPYGILAGNHDNYIVDTASSNNTYYNAYFGSFRFKNNNYYGGNYRNNENHYDLISAGGIEFIILYLSYNISEDEFAWANDILNTYRNRYAILAVHAYLASDGSYTFQGGVFKEPNSGLEIYNNLVELHDNVILVLSGHKLGAAHNILDIWDRTVHEIFINYQEEEYGGNGYLELLSFDVSKEIMHIKSYSPYLNKYSTSFSNWGWHDEFNVSFNLKMGTANILADNVNITGFTIQNSDIEAISIKSDYSNIYENRIINNKCGIKVHSSYNTIHRNIIKNNDNEGINLDDSFNTIIDNIFESNGIVINEGWDTHMIDNNTANGRIIRYYKNNKNIIVPEDTSQVILAQCTNVTIQNLNLSNVDIGVQLWQSSDNSIFFNEIASNNNYGIIFYNSSKNNIKGNSIINNKNHGVCLKILSNNTFIDNNILNNNGSGILAWYSSYNNLSGNIISDNLLGIEMKYSNDNTLIGNNIGNNNGVGIGVWDSFRNKICENTISDCLFGIETKYSDDNTIAKNTVTDNTNGIYLKISSNNNMLSENDIQNNDFYGIYLLDFSNSNIISGNIILNNIESGIFTWHSSNNQISGNAISGSISGIQTKYSDDNMILKNHIAFNNKGISMRVSSSNNITYNIITNHMYQGISLNRSSNNNLISVNTIRDNNQGICLCDFDSDYNNITMNNITKNICGIALKQPNNNSNISSNNFVENSIGFCFFGPIDDTLIYNNVFYNNTEIFHIYNQPVVKKYESNSDITQLILVWMIIFISIIATVILFWKYKR